MMKEVAHMKMYYEKPEAEIINFQAQEQLAVIDEIEDSNIQIGWKSKDI